LDCLSDAINHFSAWRLEALQAGFMPANFLTELTVIAAAISRCKSQVRMPVGNLLRQIQSLLSGSMFPSKLEAELRGKIDLNRHMDQLRERVATLETQISNFSSRRSELVAGKWERLSLALLAERREAFCHVVQRDLLTYVKSLHDLIRSLKQDMVLGTNSSSSSSIPSHNAASASASKSSASAVAASDAGEWIKREFATSSPILCRLFLSVHLFLTTAQVIEG
jgi:hypothetical protein